MPAPQVHAVVRPFTLALVALALIAPSASAGVAAPNAADDTIAAFPGGSRDVLANDSGGPLTVVANTQPANGTASCSSLGACFYKANAGFTGSDSFTYTARDGAGADDTATVSVTVTASTAQQALSAQDDEVATLQGTAKSFDPLANDTGTGKTLSSHGEPKHGTLTGCDPICNYKPDDGYTGSDGFVYAITDSSQRTARAAVHILVAPPGTAYGIDTTGGPNPVASGGQASWGLRVLGLPEGISGEELRALGLPAGSGTASGPHALSGNGLQFARGFSGEVGGDGKLSFAADNDALLGESRSQTFPRPLPPISQGTGGDGHVPILVGSKVFAIYHHQTPSAVTCVDRNTGDRCGGYPSNGKSLGFPGGNGFGTTDINGPAVVNGSRFYTHLLTSNSFSGSASIGLFCWDASTDSSCGLTIVDRVPQSSNPGASAPVQANGKMWFGGDTGKLYCVDPSSGNACGSIDTGLAPTTAFDQRYDAVTHGNRVFLSRRGGNVACVDVAAGAKCAGWETPKSFDGRWNLVNQHDATGDTVGICVFLNHNGTCLRDDAPGTPIPVANFVHEEPYSQGYSVVQEAETGTRTFVGSLDTDGVGCYDWSTMAPCTGGRFGQAGSPPGWIGKDDNGQTLPPSGRGAYGVTYDGSCLIALGDTGEVYTVDPAGSAPCVSLGSGTDRTTIDLTDQRCDQSVGGASWRDVRLSDTDGTEMESVVVTVRDARTGAVLKSGEMIGGQPLDLSGINAADHPAISIDATARSKSGDDAWDDGIPPRIRTTWKSDPQQACAKSNSDNACAASATTIGVLGRLESGASDEAQLALQRNACAAGGVQGQQARQCAGRRLFNINVRFKGKDIRKLTVKVKGKKQKVLRMKPRPRVRIDLRKYRKGRVVVQITIVTKAGKKLTGTRVYHPCTKKQPGRGFRF